MMVCSYCGNPAPEPPRSCCGEVHFDEAPECPECGESDEDKIYLMKHHADALAPECTYLECECGAQWGHS